MCIKLDIRTFITALFLPKLTQKKQNNIFVIRRFRFRVVNKNLLTI